MSQIVCAISKINRFGSRYRCERPALRGFLDCRAGIFQAGAAAWTEAY